MSGAGGVEGWAWQLWLHLCVTASGTFPHPTAPLPVLGLPVW